MAKRPPRGLGKALTSLLSETAQTAIQPVSMLEAERKDAPEQLKFLPIEFLQPGKYQPRRDMKLEALETLANSIRKQGILQPLVVRAIENNRYEIIAGERRWRASQMAGLDKIPVLVKSVDDQTTIALALIENIQREDLTPMERAISLQRFTDEFQMSHQEVAEHVGMSRAAVSNHIRLLSLHADVKQFLQNGDLEMGHARAMLSLNNSQQLKAARFVVEKNLSVRDAEQLVRRMLTAVDKPFKANVIDPDVKALQSQLTDTLGVPVEIRHGPKGKGKLIISYHNIDSLEDILDRLKVN